uniref:Uncharacterized protein n=1 Tax=Arundo donax TaxID=35708 RepID=A0A0A9AXK5_ARUDO
MVPPIFIHMYRHAGPYFLELYNPIKCEITPDKSIQAPFVKKPVYIEIYTKAQTPTFILKEINKCSSAPGKHFLISYWSL